MRHRKAGRKLNRNSSHRKALLKNLAIALIEQDIIKTTLPKAKELRKVIEPSRAFSIVDKLSIKQPGLPIISESVALANSSNVKPLCFGTTQ